LKISIVTPTLNSDKFIKDTINSINNQSYRNFEHIIVDGNSQDNTLHIIRSFEHLKLISEPDSGQSEALNKGFRMSTGDILAWQNADDLYCEETFEKIVNFFKTHPDVEMVYGGYQLVDERGTWICNVNPINWNNWQFQHGRFVPLQPTLFWRRRVYESIGDLDVQLHYCMDVDFIAKSSKKFNIALLPEILGKFRVHSASKTQNRSNKKRVRREYLQVLGRNFNYNLSDRFLFYLFSYRSDLASFVKRKWLRKI